MSSNKNDFDSKSLFTLSCNNLEEINNNIEAIWTGFNRCKAYIENGTRFENMSWRLWQYQQQQSTNYIDSKTIKRLIKSIIMSPVDIHDACSHEVSQINQKCYDSTKTQEETFCLIEHEPTPAIKEEEYHSSEDDYISEDDDDDDGLYDDDIIIEIKKDQIVYEKTQPKPTTPKRSLLSDLFGRISSPPSLLSNSTCSSISSSDDQQQQQQQKEEQKKQQQHKSSSNHDLSDILNWQEDSFHGW